MKQFFCICNYFQLPKGTFDMRSIFLNYFQLATYTSGTGCQVYEESCGKPTSCQHKCTNNTVCHEDDDEECRKPNICEQRPQRKLPFFKYKDPPKARSIITLITKS